VNRYLKTSGFYLILSIMAFSGIDNIKAQEKSVEVDSTVNELHSPKKATLLALVPGLGQIYNKKYWKLPIVYAGFGVTAYLGITNRTEYIKYNNAFKCSVIEGEDCTNELAKKYSSDELSTIKDYYRRNMELSFIVMGAWYILQILDASVDAHLYYWEIDDDLSIDIQPVIQPIIPQDLNPSQLNPYTGIKVRFKF
jgi:hypothetical protein